MKLPNKQYPITVTRSLFKYELESVLDWMKHKKANYIIGRDKYYKYVIFRALEPDDYFQEEPGKWRVKYHDYVVVNEQELLGE